VWLLKSNIRHFANLKIGTLSAIARSASSAMDSPVSDGTFLNNALFITATGLITGMFSQGAYANLDGTLILITYNPTSVDLTRSDDRVANAGGPYAIRKCESLTLDASSSFDPNGDPLTYNWDVNGDGVFGDATGVTPTICWATPAATPWNCTGAA
jgi:hypothetical protein